MHVSYYGAERLQMRCAPGTHEAAFKLLRPHLGQLEHPVVLDLAAGSGAWIQRLGDQHIDEIDAVEINSEGFRVRGITPMSVDLNLDWAHQMPRTYDVVSAIEIIEHLDNPRHFLGEARKVLRDGGILLLTSPYVSGVQGRIHFLKHGELRFFTEDDYEAQRHISPMTATHMRLALEEVGFTIVSTVTAGSFWSRGKKAVIHPFVRLANAVFRTAGIGDVAIYLARRS